MKPFSHENKTQALTRHLAEMAMEMGDGAKFPTVAQLASDMGVSIMTLNRALSELEARGLIVRRHAIGIFVTYRPTPRTVGLVNAHDIADQSLSPFWSVLVDTFRERALAKNEKLRFYMAQPLSGSAAIPEDLKEDIEAEKIQGVVVLGTNEPLHAWLLNHGTETGLPVVTFGGGTRFKTNVVLDPGAGIKLAVPELASRGCRRIGLWGPYRWLLERPFLAALSAAGLDHFPELCHYFEADLGHVQIAGQDTAWKVFGPDAQAAPPDGLIIMEDMLTRGALTTFHRLGLHPGIDVHIASHANKNSSLLQGYENSLIRLEYDPAEITNLVLDLMEAQLDGQEVQQPPLVPPHLVLPQGDHPPAG